MADYGRLRVEDLKRELKKRGAVTRVRKADLIARKVHISHFYENLIMIHTKLEDYWPIKHAITVAC